MVTAIWAGNENNVPITDKHVTGGTVLARLWREYNRQYYARNPLPAGEFIAAKYDDSSSSQGKAAQPATADMDQAAQQLAPNGQPAAGGSSPSTTATPAIIRSSRYPAAHATYSGARPPITVDRNGLARSRGKGITDYSWAH
jgi:hypothetical protein